MRGTLIFDTSLRLSYIEGAKFMSALTQKGWADEVEVEEVIARQSARYEYLLCIVLSPT